MVCNEIFFCTGCSPASLCIVFGSPTQVNMSFRAIAYMHSTLSIIAFLDSDTEGYDTS